MDNFGRLHTAVNAYHLTGGPCAEGVVIGLAAAAGAGPLITMVAVGCGNYGVIPPCGRCRQMLLDMHPDCRVIIPTDDSPANLPVRDLLPHADHHPDAHPARVVPFSGVYHDAVLAGEKTMTVRYRDPIDPGPAIFVVEDEPGIRRLEGVVESVVPDRLDQRSAVDLAAEHVGSREELRAGLAGHDPGLPDDAALTVVRFRRS